MKDLMTRKIVLGLLMTLVLAFSVQGTADARTFGTTKTGDLATVFKGQEFTIKFSVRGLKGTEAKQPNTTEARTTDIEYANGTRTRTATPTPLTKDYTETVDADGYAEGDTHYYTVTTTEKNRGGTAFTLTTQTRNWMTESEAYYFNDEAIGILAEPEGNLTLSRNGTALPLVGNTQLTTAPTSTTADLYERATDSNRQLSATTITLTGRATAVGTYTITIKYITHNGDMGPGFSLPGTETEVKFTIYVVESIGGNSENIDEWGFTKLTNGYRVNIYNDVAITTASTTTNIGVRYEIVKGSGYLYVMETDGRKGAVKKTLLASSATAVYLDPRSSTNTVRAVVAGVNARTGLFIYGEPNVKITGGNPQTGIISQRLEDSLVVRVRDGKNRAISGLPVDFDTDATGALFIPVPGTTVYVNVVDAVGTLVDTIADGTVTKVARSTNPVAASDIIVQTDSRGEAETYFQLGSTVGTQNVTVLAGAYPPIDPGMFSFEAIASTGRRARLSILSGNNQRTNDEGNLSEHLVVVVRQDGNLKSGEPVTFRTTKGTLVGRNQENNAANTAPKRAYGVTDANGQAQVEYYQISDLGSDTVTARIEGTNYEDTVTFNINGGGTRAPAPSPTPPADTTDDEDDEDDGTLIVFPSSLSGAPGAVVPMSVGPSTATITVVGDVAFILGGGLVSGTATARNVTLPDTAGSYNLSVSATGYANVTVPVTVGTATGTGTDTQPGTLTITTVGDRVGTQQQIRVTVRDAANALAVGAVTVTLTGALNPPTVSTLNGTGTVVATLPTATGAHTLTVSATGYGTSSVTVPATGSQPPAQQQPQPVGQASSIRLASEPFPSGTANTELAQPLRVQVLDANNNGVANVRVIFRVVSGQGRLSQRGNGRAVAVQTNVSGEARATYTPLSAASTVRATAASVSQTVTFTISAGSAPPPTTTPSTPDTDVTPSREIRPVVQVNASQRPPMLWVDGGAIYALVGASVQKFASGVDNALNIAVGGGKVYWTEKTGESAGTINSANLNGSNVQELASILAVPMGIAVGSDKLYWTNSRGRIQSANLDGSGITNVIPGGLEGAMDLAVAGGNAYWTQGGNVRFVNLTGQKQIRDISTGMDTANSLAIGGGKVYWAEMTGESAGTVNSANLNGTGATELASISAVPSGIAVDTARSKLYWTNSRGRIQRANLNGSGIGNVVTGLGNPGDMVSSNSITAPAATPPTTTTTASKKYDVNGDGSVDSKDVDAIIVAVAAKITDAKYDVTGDGTVDINDVVAVSANQDTGAAAAPALLGTQLSSVQIDRLQEQIDLLIASNDRSPDALRILTYLQQLIVMARPEKTQLLANYPNPFNPETWIPYELATDTDVRITIYNTQGVVIRTLALGHQSAGYYTGRDRAAYWDGRNALGEQVASGIYFYQFETDEMSSMRKMVILK